MDTSKRAINITHYINPHMFWFKYDISYVEGNSKLNILDQKLRKYLLENDEEYRVPEVGEIVCVRTFPYYNWIRAEVYKILEYPVGLHCIVWAIDQGFPMETSCKYIRKISKELQTTKVDSIYFGGINNIIPAGPQFLYESNQDAIVACDYWTPFATRKLEALIENAYEIYFSTELLYNGQNFGRMEITDSYGTKQWVNIILKDTNQALESCEFKKDLKNLRTNKLCRWLDNEKKPKLFKNKTTISSISTIDSFRSNPMAFNIVEEKIANWTKKNIEVNNKYLEDFNEDSVSVACNEIILKNITPSTHFIPVPEYQRIPTLHTSEENKSVCTTSGRSTARRESLMKEIEARKQLEELKKLEKKKSDDGDSVETFLAHQKDLRKREELRIATEQIKLTEVVPVKTNYCAAGSEGYFKSSVPKIHKKTPIATKIDIKQPEKIKEEPNKPWAPENYKAKENPIRFLNQGFDSSSSDASQIVNQSSVSENSVSPPTKLKNSKQTVYMPAGANLNSYTQNPLFNSMFGAGRGIGRYEKCLSGDAPRVLVHAKIIPTPIPSIDYANFDEAVYKQMQRERIELTETYRIQKYSWPHLMRGNSALIINAAATGKTLAYLPAIFSIILRKRVSEEIPSGVGPVAIIVSRSSREVEFTINRLKSYNSSRESAISLIGAHGIRNQEDTNAKLCNGCDILVITPGCLYRLIKSSTRFFDNERLKHLIFDDYDELVENFRTEINFIFDTLTSRNTVCQLILTSKIYQPDVLQKIEFGKNPMLCIGSYLEGFVYSKSNLSIMMISVEGKCNEILNFLHDSNLSRYRLEKTIIVCNDMEDVKVVTEFLKSSSVSFSACHEKSTPEEIESVKFTNNRDNGDYMVTVCSDYVLDETKIDSAQNIIHYSLPNSWTKFTKRFALFFNYYSNSFIDEEKRTAKSILYLNEENNIQLPKLIDFMQAHGYSNINKKILKVAEHERIKIEIQKSSNVICQEIIEYGSCKLGNNCRNRHVFTLTDAPNHYVPTEGLIKLNVLKTVTPTHYIIQLLETKLPNDKNWKPLQYMREYQGIRLNFPNFFAATENQIIHYPVSVGDLAVYEINNSFHRCEVLEILPKKQSLSEPEIRIKLIDKLEYHKCLANHLLILPDEFKTSPPLAMNLCIAGLVPHDFEHDWDKTTIANVDRWLKDNEMADITFQSNVLFSLNDTIWVDSIYMSKTVLNISAIQNSIKESILKKNFGTLKEDHLKIIKEMAAVAGIYSHPDTKNILESSIEEPSTSGDVSTTNQTAEDTDLIVSSTEVKVPKEIVKGENVIQSSQVFKDKKEKWAVLEEREFIKVDCGIFLTPENFFVTQQSSKIDLKNLYLSIIEYSKNEKLEEIEAPEPGMNCLCKDDEHIFRGKVLKLYSKKKEAEVFNMDIGYSIAIGIENIYEIPDFFIRKLPFQAVKCSLAGIKKIDDWNLKNCGDRVEDILDTFKNMIIFCTKRFDVVKNEFLDINYYSTVFFNERGMKLNEILLEENLVVAEEDFQSVLDVHFQMPIETEEEVWERAPTPIKPENKDEQLQQRLKDFNIDDFDFNFDENEITALCTNDPKVKFEKKVELPKIEEKVTDPPPIKEINEIPVKETEQFPKLISLHKNAKITWQQSDHMIVLTVEATDCVNYGIDVTNRCVEVGIEFEKHTAHNMMHLFGCIEPELVSHEIRGLSIIVRMVKLNKGVTWPRLLIQPDFKPNWLTCNYEAVMLEKEVLDFHNFKEDEKDAVIHDYDDYCSDASNSSSLNELFKT